MKKQMCAMSFYTCESPECRTLFYFNCSTLSVSLTFHLYYYLPSTSPLLLPRPLGVFVRLGTLLAERLLYAPSVGYCMLLSLGLYNTAQDLCALYSWLYSCDVSGIGEGKMKGKHTNKENENEKGEESNRSRSRDTGDGIREGVRKGLHGPGTEVVKHCSDEGVGGRVDQATLDADQSSQSDSEAARMSLPGCVSHSHSEIDSDIDSASASYSKSVLDIDRDGETDRIGYRDRDKETVQRAKYVYWVLIALITVTYSYMTVRASDSIQIKKNKSTSTLKELSNHTQSVIIT